MNHLWFLKQGVYVQYVRGGGGVHEHAYMHVTNFHGISSATCQRRWTSSEILVSAQMKVYTNSEAFEHSTPFLLQDPARLYLQSQLGEETTHSMYLKATLIQSMAWNVEYFNHFQDSMLGVDGTPIASPLSRYLWVEGGEERMSLNNSV